MNFVGAIAPGGMTMRKPDQFGDPPFRVVNQFLRDNFQYTVAKFTRVTTVENNGDGLVEFCNQGVTPIRGRKPIESLSHSIFIPGPVSDLSLTAASVNVGIIQRPPSLDVRVNTEIDSNTDEGLKGRINIAFPGGFSWTPDPDNFLSYRVSYRLPGLYVPTPEKIDGYWAVTKRNREFDWSSCYFDKPVDEFSIAVVMPPGYAPGYHEFWIWETNCSFAVAAENIGAEHIKQSDTSALIIEGRLRLTLVIQKPWLGYSYGIAWQPRDPATGRAYAQL